LLERGSTPRQRHYAIVDDVYALPAAACRYALLRFISLRHADITPCHITP